MEDQEFFFELIGLDVKDSDKSIPNGLPHMVMCKQNGKDMCVYVKGYQWDLCYWIWRLSKWRGAGTEEFKDTLALMIVDSL